MLREYAAGYLSPVQLQTAIRGWNDGTIGQVGGRNRKELRKRMVGMMMDRGSAGIDKTWWTYALETMLEAIA